MGRIWEEESTIWEYNHQRPTHSIYDTLQSSQAKLIRVAGSYVRDAAGRHWAVIGLLLVVEFVSSTAASCWFLSRAVWPIWVAVSSLQANEQHRLTTTVKQAKLCCVSCSFSSRHVFSVHIRSIMWEHSDSVRFVSFVFQKILGVTSYVFLTQVQNIRACWWSAGYYL